MGVPNYEHHKPGAPYMSISVSSQPNWYFVRNGFPYLNQ